VTGNQVHDLTGHSGPVRHLASRLTDPYCLYATSDSKLYLYDIRTGEMLKVLMELEIPVNDLKTCNDDSFLFLSSGVKALIFFSNSYNYLICRFKRTHCTCSISKSKSRQHFAIKIKPVVKSIVCRHRTRATLQLQVLYFCFLTTRTGLIFDRQDKN
jgi:hypothetical protein